MKIITCKDFTKDISPIHSTNKFLLTDKAVVCIAMLDAVSKPSNIELIWSYGGRIVHQLRKHAIPDANASHHRFASLLKMALIEKEKYYGEWKIMLKVNGHVLDTQSLTVVKPYIGYQSLNSFLDIKG